MSTWISSPPADDVQGQCTTSVNFLPKIDLSKISPNKADYFQSRVIDYLNTVNLHDFEVLCCQDTACDSSKHKAEIDLLYSHLSNCLINASKLCFGQTHANTKDRKSIPGWNDYVLDAKIAASDAYHLWHQWNKPKSGPIFDLMQRTRARYKYSIRYCRQHKNQIQADTIAGLLTRQNFSSFWKNVSRTMSRDLSYLSKVANATGATDICNLWYTHYKTLFSSVGYESHTMEGILDNVSDQISMTLIMLLAQKFAIS